jgi:hypothetical protein
MAITQSKFSPNRSNQWRLNITNISQKTRRRVNILSRLERVNPIFD